MAGRRWRELRIHERLKDRPWLEYLSTSLYCIPERLREYNPNLFLVYNHLRRKHEIHSLEHYPDSYAMTTPYRPPDVRTLRDLWKNDVRVHGRDIFRRVDLSEQEYKARKERQWHNWLQAVGRETYRAFAVDAWDGSKTLFAPKGRY